MYWLLLQFTILCVCVYPSSENDCAFVRQPLSHCLRQNTASEPNTKSKCRKMCDEMVDENDYDKNCRGYQFWSSYWPKCYIFTSRYPTKLVKEYPSTPCRFGERLYHKECTDDKDPKQAAANSGMGFFGFRR